MSIFCCVACGGKLIKKENSNLYVCEYCGTIQTDPSSREREKSAENIRNIESIIKRTYMYLEEANWRKANEYADKVLDIDPECAEAYLLKLMADERARTEDRLIYLAVENDPKDVGYGINYRRITVFSDIDYKNKHGCNYNWEGNMNYIRAYQYGTDELKARLSKYIEYRTYRTGLNVMNSGTNIDTYEKAISLFQSAINCEDSKIKIQICEDRIREIQEREKRAKEVAHQKEEQQKKAEQREIIVRLKVLAILITIIASYYICCFFINR